jgi:hypothetical protein
MSFSCVLRHAGRGERRACRWHRKICMLNIMQKFSIILIMQIVKGGEEKNGLLTGTKG